MHSASTTKYGSSWRRMPGKALHKLTRATVLGPFLLVVQFQSSVRSSGAKYAAEVGAVTSGAVSPQVRIYSHRTD